MPHVDIENYLNSLKENYTSLSQAYRRGYFEDDIKFNVKGAMWGLPIRLPIIDPGRKNKSIPFREAAASLFEQAKEHETYQNQKNLSVEIKEQLAEYKIRAQALSYEISDYFIAANNEMSKHFRGLARDISKDVKSYYQGNYDFVITPKVKVNIIKQVVLSALFGVNALYRSYEATSDSDALHAVDNLINFLEEDFSDFCGRDDTAFGLIGLAYFLKGKLLLNQGSDNHADKCFRWSAENYVKKLGVGRDVLSGTQKDNNKGDRLAQPVALLQSSTDVPISELLALRRAALVLAFGSGYSALINSRVKEANSLLTLARGILHFNAPKVYAAYVTLLYWSAKRAEKSDNEETLLEAKERIEECRKIFEAQVADSHYPHRASLEHSLVLHYLAQRQQPEAQAYYQEAVEELKAAVNFAKGEGSARRPNKQLYIEACYILSHILRYQSETIITSNEEASIARLKEAYGYAKAAENAAKSFPRHKCEALLALCGVYMSVSKRGINLLKIDPSCDPDADPGRLSRVYACKVLEINNGTNHRISAICYLRLVDYYLNDPDTYSRAYTYWEEWLKIRDSIEHAFVQHWAARVESKLDEIRERSFVIDFGKNRDVIQLRDTLNAQLARHKIAEWVRESHSQYEFKGKEIKHKKLGKRGPNVSLQKGLEDLLVKNLRIKASEARALITKYELLAMAKTLMESYLS